MDIRRRVEGDRGSIKEIQLFVPGFRGYREREDLRDSDRLLRKQLAHHLEGSKAVVESLRREMAEAGEFSSLEAIGSLIAEFERVSRKINSAEGGYSGISPNVRIEERELDSLYEYDSSLIAAVREIRSMVEGAGDDGARRRLRSSLRKLEERIDSRMDAISGTEVMG